MTFWRTPLLSAAILALTLDLTLVNGCSGKDNKADEGSGGSSTGLGGAPALGGAAALGGEAGLGGSPALGGRLNQGGNNPQGAAGEAGQGLGAQGGASAGEGPGLGVGGEGGAKGDACQGVSTDGQCVKGNGLVRCVVPTGNGSPTLVTQTCRSFESCVEDSDGAHCVVNNGACLPGASECQGTTLRSCADTATWESFACPGACEESPAGAFCPPTLATSSYTGKIEYEAFTAKSDLSDWSTTSTYLPAVGVMVVSMHGDDVLGASLVQDDGAFTIKVAATPATTDRLVFLLLHPAPGGATAEFGVFDPDVSTGTASVESISSASVWQWAVQVRDFPSGSTIQIDENSGSGAVHVYNYLRLARAFVTNFYGQSPKTVVAWMHLNTEWDCGACFAPLPVEAQSLPFDSQLFFSATARDRAYWSNAVTVHEIGHYTMWSYGVSPMEGGTHCQGVPTAPGQAWSEGWATGFSSIARDSPIYYDKQQGTMFWVDLDNRAYEEGPFVRPKPKGGLLQDIDENEVAAMLWKLSQSSVGSDAVLAGLQAKEVVEEPFRRGYTRRQWDVDNLCQRVDEQDSGQSVPMLADYLDGLRCANVPAASIDAVTNPDTAYPYPSGTPLCAR